MDRPSGISMEKNEEGQQPEKEDGLPCYTCAINNLKNCSHVDRGKSDAVAPSAVSNNSDSLVHQGYRDPPPSYMTSISPEQASPGHVAVTLEAHQRATPNSDSICADVSDEMEEVKLCTRKHLFWGFVFGGILLWIVYSRALW